MTAKKKEAATDLAKVGPAQSQEVLAPAPQPTDIMQAIIQASKDPTVDVDKFERLTALYERMEAGKAERVFNEAMNAAQHDIRPIAANASNPQTKSKYADYMALDKALRPIYIKHGFALSFNTGAGAPPEHVRVLCDVSHNGGHVKQYQADMPADGKGAKGNDVMTKTHATGSAFTYGMRYLLKMIFNIVTGDDDGNAAGAGELISAEMLLELEAKLESVSGDKVALCTYMGVQELTEIRVKDLPRAYIAIGRKAQMNIDDKDDKGQGDGNANL